jgi:hypothetical protein
MGKNLKLTTKYVTFIQVSVTCESVYTVKKKHEKTSFRGSNFHHRYVSCGDDFRRRVSAQQPMPPSEMNTAPAKQDPRSSASDL